MGGDTDNRDPRKNNVLDMTHERSDALSLARQAVLHDPMERVRKVNGMLRVRAWRPRIGETRETTIVSPACALACQN